MIKTEFTNANEAVAYLQDMMEKYNVNDTDTLMNVIQERSRELILKQSVEIETERAIAYLQHEFDEVTSAIGEVGLYEVRPRKK